MEKGAENYAEFQEAVRRTEEATEVMRGRLDEQSMVIDQQEAKIVHLEDLVHSLVVEVVSLRTDLGRLDGGPVGPTMENEEGLPECRSSSSSTSRGAGPATTMITVGTSQGTGGGIPLDRMGRLTVIQSVGREATVERFPMVRYSLLREGGVLILL